MKEKIVPAFEKMRGHRFGGEDMNVLISALTSAWNHVLAFVIKYIAEPMKTISPIDILDILILAFILYRLLRFIRNRRAGRVALGLILVILVCIVVSLAHFPTLSYISSLFAASAFFCIVVLFQPEIRDALEHLGNSRIFAPRSHTISRKRYGQAESFTDELVDAVYKMAKSRTGALIVLEGLTKLGDFMATGKPMDSAVSSPLLQNIFYDKAPLHDGALIISDMRIVAASCVLPSSRKKLEEDHLGTRHRAAVGITEVSDALVIVISEETGTVSVAQEGRLLRRVDSKTMKDILMTYVAGSAYLHKKRANMRTEYLQMLDRIGQVRPVKKEEPSDQEELDRSIQEFISEEEAGKGKKASQNVNEAQTSETDSVDDVVDSMDSEL